jgi:hypothetical protein
MGSLAKRCGGRLDASRHDGNLALFWCSSADAPPVLELHQCGRELPGLPCPRLRPTHSRAPPLAGARLPPEVSNLASAAIACAECSQALSHFFESDVATKFAVSAPIAKLLRRGRCHCHRHAWIELVPRRQIRGRQTRYIASNTRSCFARHRDRRPLRYPLVVTVPTIGPVNHCASHGGPKR